MEVPTKQPHPVLHLFLSSSHLSFSLSHFLHVSALSRCLHNEHIEFVTEAEPYFPSLWGNKKGSLRIKTYF